ncbi:unnamed protein product, partial [Brassica rapa subsp. narinosa]
FLQKHIDRICFHHFLVVSNVHCYPDFDVKQDYKKCYLPCKQTSEGCERFCAARTFSWLANVFLIYVVVGQKGQ